MGVQAERQTKETEGHLFVLSGSTTCPHPKLCDVRKGEDYEAYVRRHAREHQLGDFGDLEDAERNLGVWCLYFYARHIQGNLSLGTGKAIKADWEPCWEDAEILANTHFSLEDTEQDVAWDQRTFRLLPAAERTGTPVYKPWKKLTKVRGTQKTSWGLAFITFKHLRAYFLFGNTAYRCLTISATSSLARDSYFEPLKTMWSSHETLMRLYGIDVQKKGKDENGDPIIERLCLLAPGSRGKDRLRTRWNLMEKRSSGKTAISVMCAGIRTVTTGKRWDLISVDDPVVPENVGTEPQRKKVEAKLADLRKQADARCEIAYFNTPYHLSDASSKIDAEQGNLYHIFYRPAMWYDTATKLPVFYWEENALGEPVWTPQRIENERHQPDFWSQVMLRTRNAESAAFAEEDFPILKLEDAPDEVRFGLGKPLTAEEQESLATRHLEVRAMNFFDSAGDKPGAGDRSADIGVRIDRAGNIVVTHIAYGRWTTTQEEDEIWSGMIRNQPAFVEFEVSGAMEKYVRKTHADLQARKSVELRRPITIPIVYKAAQSNVAGTKGKLRIAKMNPLAKTGRIRILEDAGSVADRKQLIDEFVNLGITDHDDGADALSRVLGHVTIFTAEEAVAAIEAKPVVAYDDETHTFTVPADVLNAAIAGIAGPGFDNWGLRGRP